jgi:hypothetical protein
MERRIENEKEVMKRMARIEEIAAVYVWTDGYRECAHQLASRLNWFMRYGVDNNITDQVFDMIALAWYYAKKEFKGTEREKDTEDYESFMEALRTDVYMELYRWVNNYYGFVEPKKQRK